MGASRKKASSSKRTRKHPKVAHTPHDALFHFTFGNVEHAGPTIASMLPKHVAARIDFASLALANGHFIDPELSSVETDLLFTATIGGRAGKIYLLFEHQSSSEHLMILRLLRYLLRIWDEYVQNNPGTKTLPVILPLVLHHSAGGWTSPLRLEELLDIDKEGMEDIKEFVPRFGMVMQDISHVSDEDLMGRAQTAFARLTLLLFRHARSAKSAQELCDRLARYVELVDEVLHASNGARAFAAVMRYIRGVTYESAKEVRMAMERSELISEKLYWDIRDPGKRQREAALARGLKRGLQRGLEKGLAKGIAEGREKGIAEGQAEGRRTTLLKLLQVRFEKVPAWAVKRVQAASIQELDEMTVKILRAATLEDVVGRPAQRKRTAKK